MAGRLQISTKKSYCPWSTHNVQCFQQAEAQAAEEEKTKQQHRRGSDNGSHSSKNPPALRHASRHDPSVIPTTTFRDSSQGNAAHQARWAYIRGGTNSNSNSAEEASDSTKRRDRPLREEEDFACEKKRKDRRHWSDRRQKRRLDPMSSFSEKTRGLSTTTASFNSVSNCRSENSDSQATTREQLRQRRLQREAKERQRMKVDRAPVPRYSKDFS